jgi:outer membrane protein assembly factor BamB
VASGAFHALTGEAFVKLASFFGLALGGLVAAQPTAALSQTSVPTYHYDTYRTGWNYTETTLTAANFPSNFGLIGVNSTFDDLIDAQPLVVPGLTIAGGTHDVVYVETQSNTVYAVDANTGVTLFSRNLGTPVTGPVGCIATPNVGITSTPVIDLASKQMFVMAYVAGSTGPSYQLHTLSLTTLLDARFSPVTVTASHTLTNGTTYNFNAAVQQQRPALLAISGTIYAGFGSFCDYEATLSRGWLLGWTGSPLAPLASNQLDDRQATSSTSFFLSSIWMSGYGLAGGFDIANGGNTPSIMFATGNSDCNVFVSPVQCPLKSTYDGVTNIQESVVKIGIGLTSLSGIFTPPSSTVLDLDSQDMDVGSGGVMMLPPQNGNDPDLAVQAGKDGALKLLNRDNMSTLLDAHQLQGCWCGPSFFIGSDGVQRIVTSQGNTLSTWQLQLSPNPHLVQEGSATIPVSGQDPGFFTTVSSNGAQAESAIIWAVGRPTTSTTLTLYAFAATESGGTYQELFAAPAGIWPVLHDADVVPVVANGKVYVASYRMLAIFGVPSGATTAIAAPSAAATPLSVAPDSAHSVTGVLTEVSGSALTLQTRSGDNVTVDFSQASQNQRIQGPLTVGKPFIAIGSSTNAAGELIARSILRAKSTSSQLWPPDR